MTRILSPGRIVLIVLGGLALSVVLLGFSFYGWVNGLRTESIQYETTLSAQYQSNQNYLSAFVSGFYEQMGVANLKSSKLDTILTDAVKGRYDARGGFSAQGAFFAAIKESYPDLSGLAIYDKLSDYIVAQRAGYRNIQDKLLDQLRAYDAWRADGFVQSWVVRSTIGVPTERLEARLAGVVARGSAARDQMYLIVLTGDAVKAYQTGLMAPLVVK